MKKNCSSLKNSSIQFLKENKKIFLFLLLVYFVSLLPLFRANFNYRDDGGRVLWAFDGWNNFGRVVSNSLSHVIHADKYLRDISPLTQVLAIVFLVIASLLLIAGVQNGKRINLWDAVSVVPLGLFPYFLCCFSYKFDSPYMALSVLFSIFPLVFRKNEKAFYLIAFVCTLLMCATYQASAGVFPMLVVFTALQDWLNGEKNGRILRYCLLSALVYLSAWLIFLVFFPMGDSGYVDEKMAFHQLSVRHIIENYLTYIITFKRDFRVKWFALIGIISAIFLVRNAVGTSRKTILALFIEAAAVLCMFLFSFGAYPFLDEPFVMPRGMYGLSVFITLICLGANTENSRIDTISVATKVASRFLVVVLSWMCVVFTCTYGNALAAQKQYDEFRVSEIAIHLAETQSLNGGDPAKIQIVGNVGYAAGIKNIPGDRVLLRLVPPPFGGENYWSYLKLLSYYGLPAMDYSDELSDEEYTSWNISHDNSYHTLYEKDGKIVVELKN